MVLEQENKSLRFLLERVIDHRHKSHNELVLIMTNLVSKLPLKEIWKKSEFFLRPPQTPSASATERRQRCTRRLVEGT